MAPATTPSKLPCDNSPLHDLANSETLCELDIPESEIHEYIRDPEEVVEHEKLMKELEESDEETDSEVGESEKDDDEMDKNESDKDDTEIHKDAAENVFGENSDNLVTGEKSLSENYDFSQPSEADEGTEATTEQESEVTDEDASKEKTRLLSVRNPPKRKAPLVPNTELLSKRPLRRISNRNGHMKISQQKITRLRRNREQRQANAS